MGLLALALFAEGPVRLKQRTIQTGGCGAEPCPAAVRTPSFRGRPVRHFLVQFSSFPGAEVRDELARRRIRVLSYVPELALMVAGPNPLPLAGLDVRWSGVLEASDKLSSALDSEPGTAFLAVFHPDVEGEAARALARELGFDVIENPALLPGQLLLAGAAARLPLLAARDEAAYIMPASADLVAGTPVAACAGPLTEAGPIAEYALAGSGWPRNASGGVALGYSFGSLTEKMDPNTAKAEVERAFGEWARYANVTFTPAQAAKALRSIDILFGRRAHGDAYSFDGPGGVLAHTFYPSPPNSEPVAGDMHFDADEAWRAGADLDLYSVALHEAGHALGLAHSDRPGAVMYPYYRGTAGLGSDDIAGARALYGAPVGQTPAAPPPSTPAQPPVTPPVQPPVTPPAARDTVPPALRILSPALTVNATSATSILVTGTALDNVGVAAVTWAASGGSSGQAAGTASWSATVPLLVGTNNVTIRAYDAAGNAGWRSITVIRR